MVPSATKTPAPIVVGVDGSPSSLRALRRAVELGTALGHPVEAITTWAWPLTGIEFIPADWRPELDAETILAEAVAETFPEGRPEGLEARIEQGSAARVLIEASRGAHLIVVGSRGHGGFAGLLLGSVSSAVVTHARCPVLVERSRDEDEG